MAPRLRSTSARLGERPKRTGITPRSPNSSWATSSASAAASGSVTSMSIAGMYAVSAPVLAPAHVRISAGLASVLCCHPGIEGRFPAQDRRIAVGLHLRANIDGGHCGFPPVGERPPASGADGPGSILKRYLVVEEVAHGRVRLGHAVGGMAPDHHERRRGHPADARVAVLKATGAQLHDGQLRGCVEHMRRKWRSRVPTARRPVGDVVTKVNSSDVRVCCKTR